MISVKFMLYKQQHLTRNKTFRFKRKNHIHNKRNTTDNVIVFHLNQSACTYTGLPEADRQRAREGGGELDPKILSREKVIEITLKERIT